MNINLANIDFCPGGKSATLTETTAEILLNETEKVIVPPEGTDGFNKVTITHAPVEEVVSTTITENGTHTITPSAGFGAMFGVNVDVNVPIKTEVAKDITITENGNTTYTPNEGEVFNRVSVDVNIPSVTDDKIQYFYKKPTADDTGLKAIGWTDDDVNYYKYNNYVYPWEADNYKVSDANKQIVINNKSDIATYASNPDFKYCPKFDTNNVTNMMLLFETCKYIRSIPLINTSKVTNMSYMFRNCSSLTAIPQLDTSNVTDMSKMFSTCSSLTAIPQLDTSNVTDMNFMLSSCSSLASIPLINTSKVTDMSNMFQKCSSLTTIPQLNTQSVKNMSTMFSGCKNLTNIPQLDTSKVTDMSYMFESCSFLNSIPKLDATSLTNTSSMFGSSWSSLNNFTDFGGLTNLKVNLNLSPCPKLTHDSLMNVINEAGDVTSNPQTLTLGSTNLAKLTDEEKAIATNKGWTLN